MTAFNPTNINKTYFPNSRIQQLQFADRVAMVSGNYKLRPPMKDTALFFTKSVIVGLLFAAITLVIWPLLAKQSKQATVQLVQSATPLPTEGTFSYAQAVQSAAPAVVNVYSEKIVEKALNPILQAPQFNEFTWKLIPRVRQEKQSSLGSGVIISEQGYLLTNLHVIQGASEIHVTLFDGRSTQATVVGTDKETDLAVLKIELDHLPTIALSMLRPIQVGDVTLAIGNPFGVGQTVTMGIISATNRNHLGINTFENFLQTDAAINPGNSGGALINPLGELIGINTAIFSKTGGSQGIGFAIPIDLAYDVFNQIIQHGRTVRGWLGVRAMTLTPKMAEILGVSELKGAIIEGGLSGGPAAKAGLQQGDIITHIDNEPANSTYDILIKVSNTPPGESIKLSGVRESKTFSVTITAAERPAN